MTGSDSPELDLTSQPPVRFLTDTISDPPVEPEVLVRGLVRRGELVVIGAPRGAFKSWLMLGLAEMLGRGTGRFLDEFEVISANRVLLYHGELDPWTAHQRWMKLLGTGQPPSTIAETFEPFRLRVMRRRFTSTTRDKEGSHTETDEWLDAQIDEGLTRAVEENRFDVVLIDPWRSFFLGSESSNDEVEAGLSALSSFVTDHDLTVILIHHFSQSGRGRDPEDSWRGASRLPDWASLRITLDPYYTKTQARKQGLSRSQARRYAWARFLARRDETPGDMPVQFDTESGLWRRWRDATQVADERRNSLTPEDVVDACRTAGGSWPSIRRAASDLSVSQAVAGRVLAEAELRGQLVEFEGPRGARGYRIPSPKRDAEEQT